MKILWYGWSKPLAALRRSTELYSLSPDKIGRGVIIVISAFIKNPKPQKKTNMPVGHIAHLHPICVSF